MQHESLRMKFLISVYQMTKILEYHNKEHPSSIVYLHPHLYLPKLVAHKHHYPKRKILCMVNPTVGLINFDPLSLWLTVYTNNKLNGRKIKHIIKYFGLRVVHLEWIIKICLWTKENDTLWKWNSIQNSNY